MTEEPVKYLIQTHNHNDHAGGNEVFRNAGAELVAHKEAVDWILAHPNPNTAIPDNVWNGTEHVISLGNRTVEVQKI